MGEDQHGPSFHKTVEGILNNRLVFRIHRRQCFVQHQDRRIAKQRARNGDALALAARQAYAALTDHRVIALGQARNEFMGVGRCGRGFHFRLARPWFAEENIFADRAVKQIGVLINHRQLAAKIGEAEIAQILPAQPDRARSRVVLAQQQLHHGGFAATGRPDDADTLAFFNLETEPFMGAPPGAGIGEGDVIELDGGLERLGNSVRRDFLHHRLRI